MARRKLRDDPLVKLIPARRAAAMTWSGDSWPVTSRNAACSRNAPRRLIDARSTYSVMVGRRPRSSWSHAQPTAKFTARWTFT